jgi:replicative DNA helicase
MEYDTGYENGLDLESTVIAMIFAKEELIKELFIEECVFLNPENRRMIHFLKRAYSVKQSLDMDLLLSLLKDEDKQNKFMNYYAEHSILFPNFSMFYKYQERLEEIYIDTKLTELADKYKNGKISSEDFVLKIKELEKENLVVKDTHDKLTPDEMLKLIRGKDKLIKFNRFDVLNQKLKIKKNTINIIAARPSEGKSALALNLFVDLASNYKCLYFNMEMTKEEVYERIIGIYSRIKIANIIKPETDYQDSLIKQNAEEIYKLNYEIVNGSKNIKSLISKIIKEQKDEHLIVFIDYVGYVSNKAGQSDKDRIGEITRMLNDVTKDYDVTIFLIAQINRNGTDMPTMKDLKDSGELEQSADTILLIHDELKDSPSLEKPIKILVPKCRGGARNTSFGLRYLKECQRMEEINESFIIKK